MAQKRKKAEQPVEEAEVSEAAPEEVSHETPKQESQAVLDHRAKLKRMDETRGY